MAKRSERPAFANTITQLGPRIYSWRLFDRSCTWTAGAKGWKRQAQAPLRRARRACVIEAVERGENAGSESPDPGSEISVSPDFIDALLLEAEREERAAAAAGNGGGDPNTVHTFFETTEEESDRGSVTAEMVNIAGNNRDDVNVDDISDFFLDDAVMDDDELVSNDTHVVVNGSDFMEILSREKANDSTTIRLGRNSESSSLSVANDAVDTTFDASNKISSAGGSGGAGDPMLNAASAVFDPDGSFEAALQKAAEELSDERYAQRPKEAAFSGGSVPLDERVNESGEEEGNEGMMEYFTDENAMYMPSWIREMYEANAHHEFQRGADRLAPSGSMKRLQDIAERRRAPKVQGSDVKHDDGIVDCTVGDVAYDYHVPVEFIVDALLAIGIPIPITESTSIRDSMTTEEITRLLRLVSTHDPAVLSDRYSDSCIEEVAEAYNVLPDDIISICKKEGLYLCNGAKTHLSTVREDRVMDILLKGEVLGKPYPPLLEGLE